MTCRGRGSRGGRRSQIPEAPLSPVTQVESHDATGSQFVGEPGGSNKQEATGSLDLEALSDPGGQEPLQLEPMEVDVSDPQERV
jgi:hypothetical protein